MPQDFDAPSYTHGANGTAPPDSEDYVDGDPYPADVADWVINTLVEKLKDIDAAFTTLDSDRDGVVDKADYATDADASTYKGNDVDSDGDGKVDRADVADDADLLLGSGPSHYLLNVLDSGTSVLADATGIDFGPNLSVTDNGDGTVTIEGTAETYPSVSDDGTEIVGSSQDINFGSNVTAVDDGDGTVTVNAGDNATSYKGNDIDSNGDGKVNSAETADQVTGPDNTAHTAGSVPRFSDKSTGLNNTNEGDLFYNNADNSLYLNDGT